MLERLKKWWRRRSAPAPIAPQQMQALVEINLLEIHLAALDGLRTQATSVEKVRTRTHAWLATFRRHGLSGSREWAELKAEARTLNQELTTILAARQHIVPSPDPPTD